MIFVWLTLFALPFAEASARYDNYKIRKYWGKIRSLNHKKRLAFRLAIVIIACVVMNYFQLRDIHVPQLSSVVMYLCTIAYTWFLFAGVFDIRLNLLLGRPWYYLGETSDMDYRQREYGQNDIILMLWIESFICVISIIGYHICK